MTTSMQRLALSLILGCLAASAPLNAEEDKTYATPPPFTAEAFWQKVFALLNEHDGYVTRERFEKTFGVRLTPVPSQDPNTISYALRAGDDWYFTTRLTLFSDAYTDRIEPYTNGAHSHWSLYWSEEAFGDPRRQQCLTVARVQADLLSAGWVSPWQLVPQPPLRSLARPAHKGSLTPVLEELPPPSHNFGRRSDLHTDRWGHLPFGQFSSTGESPDTCVTGFYIRARP